MRRIERLLKVWSRPENDTRPTREDYERAHGPLQCLDAFACPTCQDRVWTSWPGASK